MNPEGEDEWAENVYTKAAIIYGDLQNPPEEVKDSHDEEFCTVTLQDEPNAFPIAGIELEKYDAFSTKVKRVINVTQQILWVQTARTTGQTTIVNDWRYCKNYNDT